MRLAIEYVSYNRFDKYFQKIVRKYNSATVKVTVVFDKATTLRPYLYLRRHNVNDVTLDLNVTHLNSLLVRLAGKEKIALLLRVTKPLTTAEKRKLNLLKVPTVVVDTSRCTENGSYYKTNRALIVGASINDACTLADVTEIACGGSPRYGCAFQSCMGKTLYVSSNGKVSFCIASPTSSVMGDIDDADDFFNSQLFNDVIDKEIKKRDECKNSCKYFYVCHGGCAQEDLCDVFKQQMEKAVQLRDKTCKEGDLEDLPLSLRRAVLSAASKGYLKEK